MTIETVTAVGVESVLTVRDGKLYRDGREHRILSGALHYFRVHPAQWEDRLRRLAALGLNTVDTYVPWNFHERSEGDIRFDGWQNLEEFITLAGDIGLDVFLRPSPYICAEWSNGGLPSWLTGRVSALRTSDPEFLQAVTNWYDQLMPRIAPLQASHGGPIVAVQLENEYGSFGSDRAYLEFLRDDLRRRGIVELVTTADGITGDMLHNGNVAGVMPTFTFGTGVARAIALKPEGAHLMCSELWGGWFDHWGEKHHVRSAASMMGTVSELLDAGGSVSLYMAHGGTNFGLWNGSNYDGRLQPTVTSYDSDAPIGEDGSINDKFLALRAALAPFHDGELPPVPSTPTTQKAQTVSLTPAQSLFDFVRSLPIIGSATPRPQTFEQLGVEDGIVVYSTREWVPEGATLSITELFDRATVFLDGQRLGTLERDGATSIALTGGDREVDITLVVESLGRINYGPLTGQAKGIIGGVLIDQRRYVHGWTHRAMPLDAPTQTPPAEATNVTDGVARATVHVDHVDDSWLAFPGATKGMVWLNGFLLGRYWGVGPQETLYAPAPLWKTGGNEIVILEMDGLGSAVELRERPSYGETEEFIGS